MSLPVSKYVSSWVTSVMVGDDWITRLGRRSIYALRIRIIDALNKCPAPKCRVLCICCDVPESNTAADQNDPRDVINQGGPEHMQLYMPGKIVHFVRRGKRHFVAVWTKCEQHTEIVVSKKMIPHHVPTVMQRVMDRTIVNGNV